MLGPEYWMPSWMNWWLCYDCTDNENKKTILKFKEKTMSKIYIPKSQCKAIKWNFWEFYNISFNIEELKTFQNEKWYVNLTMNQRKEVDQYWNTHYFTLNQYEPK